MGSTDEVETSSYVHADLLPGVLATTVGYASSVPAVRVHRGVPSPWLTFILSLDDPIVWSEGPSGLGTAAERREPVVLGALHTKAAYVRMPRQQSGIQMAVHPLAARRVFGTRSVELAAAGVSGVEVLGPEVEALRQRLVETAGWAERFALLRTYLRARVEQAPSSAAVRPELAEAWRWIRRAGGNARLDGLAEHVALSPRHLTTLFDRELGLSPKRVARLVRFDRASRRLTAAVTSGHPLDLARVAAECGFYDQSHLDRDFHDHLGTSPTGWLVEERRNIQAGGHRNGES